MITTLTMQLRLVRQENPQWTPHELVAQATRPSAGSRGRVDQASLAALQGDIAQMATNLSGLDGAIAERLKLAEERRR